MPERQKDYKYTTCCVDIPRKDVPALNQMIEEAQAITYNTMVRNCFGLSDWAANKGYDQTLRLKNDWAVSFYKSKFKGQPCFFLRWSAIEFIWVKN